MFNPIFSYFQFQMLHPQQVFNHKTQIQTEQDVVCLVLKETFTGRFSFSGCSEKEK